MTALALVLWLLVGEAVGARRRSASASPGCRPREWAEAISPLRAIFAAARPTTGETVAAGRLPLLGDSVRLFMIFAAGLTVLLNVVAIALVRVWNPTRELRATADDERDESSAPRRPPASSVHAAPGRVREVWDNPILWREICTWAYGKKVVLVRLAYLAVFAACAAAAVARAANRRPGCATAPRCRPRLRPSCRCSCWGWCWSTRWP